jgi:hypothetical protein
MTGENAVGEAVDPVPAVTDLAVGRIGEMGPKRSANPANTCSGVSRGMLPTSSKSPATIASVLCWYASPQNVLRDAYDERELALDKIERGTPPRAPLEITCNAALLGSLTR